MCIGTFGVFWTHFFQKGDSLSWMMNNEFQGFITFNLGGGLRSHFTTLANMLGVFLEQVSAETTIREAKILPI